MNIPFDLVFFDQFLSQAREYFYHNVLAWGMVVQIGVIALALFWAHHVTGAVRSWLTRQQEQHPTFQESGGEIPFLRVIEPMLAVIFLWIAQRTAHHFDWPREGLQAALIASIALFFIHLFITQMKNRIWARILMAYLWLWALLYIFHVMDPWIKYLNHIDFQLGKVQLSLLTIYRACFLSFILYWLSRNLLIIWRFWLTKGSGFAPALQVLLYKLGSIFLFSVSGVAVLHYLGLDFTVFALFSWALGLGLGFGLQKVFANLVSGFILLADKSIKPGDVIEVKDTYGWINYLGSRYISVISRNGTEHLIPNENLVTGEVINWSYSNKLIRLKVPIGVAYGSDLEKARDLMLESAAVPRVLKEPEPSCRLLGFGDNAINLELRVWINDPQEGVTAVKSDIFWGIWRRFREHGIEIPYPQRDVHIKSFSEERLRTKDEKG
jgi:small-conductance mechanosensitive channel